MDDLAPVACVPPVNGVAVLIMSDGPRNFLCAALATAALHGLNPAVREWDPPMERGADGGWPAKHTFNYYVGATILLPLHFVMSCAHTADLVLVADRDVVFQCGARHTLGLREGHSRVLPRAR